MSLLSLCLTPNNLITQCLSSIPPSCFSCWKARWVSEGWQSNCDHKTSWWSLYIHLFWCHHCPLALLSLACVCSLGIYQWMIIFYLNMYFSALNDLVSSPETSRAACAEWSPADDRCCRQGFLTCTTRNTFMASHCGTKPSGIAEYVQVALSTACPQPVSLGLSQKLSLFVPKGTHLNFSQVLCTQQSKFLYRWCF